MTSINAATMLMTKKKVAAPAPKPAAKIAIGAGSKKKAVPARRGSVAPPLKAKALLQAAAIAALQGELNADTKRLTVMDLFNKAVGASSSVRDLSAPHAASTTRDRSSAAADLAVATKYLSVKYVLKDCGILNELQRNLFPDGIETLLTRGGDGEDEKSNDGLPTSSGGLKPSTSAVSLLGLLDDCTIATMTTANSNNTDSKRGKSTPPAAREGCLLILRALCEIVGKPVEPFIVGAFLVAALDECASANSAVREAAEDTAKALVSLAHPWSFKMVLSPIIVQSLKCTEWRVKAAALEILTTVAETSPKQVHHDIPTLIPACTNQVWDTKPQVSKGARAALLAICDTNVNADIKPAIPAVVNAICKPAETNKAVSELMCTTFIMPVDASTLAILCPVLARALKEKLAIHKRAACIVIANMAKLVDSPASVAPFGSLLVPELQKVALNVQFEEIRDESLKALKELTKALGDKYRAAEEKTDASPVSEVSVELNALEQVQVKVEAEQLRIQQLREAEAAQDEAYRVREEEERKKFKEAMDAQRRLDQVAEDEAAASKTAEQLAREMQKLSTKDEAGKCQGCGLKKCKKTCNFFSE